MTNDQAISLLSKIDVEQRTLKDLWGQFSVALAQIGAVLKHYGEVSLLIPKMEIERDRLQTEITKLEADCLSLKEETQKEVVGYRASLEKAVAPLEKEVKDLREKVVATQGALRSAEEGAKDRIQRLTGEVGALESRRDAAKEAIRNLHTGLASVESV